jgi:hypothetical protein
MCSAPERRQRRLLPYPSSKRRGYSNPSVHTIHASRCRNHPQGAELVHPLWTLVGKWKRSHLAGPAGSEPKPQGTSAQVVALKGEFEARPKVRPRTHRGTTHALSRWVNSGLTAPTFHHRHSGRSSESPYWPSPLPCNTSHKAPPNFVKEEHPPSTVVILGAAQNLRIGLRLCPVTPPTKPPPTSSRRSAHLPPSSFWAQLRISVLAFASAL